MRRARLAALILLLIIVSVLVPATPAGAHAEIRDSDPEQGGTASVGLDELELVFITMDPDEPVEVSVLDPEGDDVTAGEPVIGETEPTGTTVTVPLEPLEEGTHVVEWRATSTDGDGVSTGTFEFDVEEAPGGGFGIWLVWIVALGIPALIFLRPGARRRRRD